MKLANYQTGILAALKDRIKPPTTHPKRAFYWPTDGWITETAEIVRALRLDEDIAVTPAIRVVRVAPKPRKQTKRRKVSP